MLRHDVQRALSPGNYSTDYQQRFPQHQPVLFIDLEPYYQGDVPELILQRDKDRLGQGPLAAYYHLTLRTVVWGVDVN